MSYITMDSQMNSIIDTFGVEICPWPFVLTKKYVNGWIVYTCSVCSINIKATEFGKQTAMH